MDDDLRAYLLGEDPKYPDASDLVGRWDLVPDDENRDVARESLVWRYWHYSHRERWAWDALAKLLRTLRERKEKRMPAALVGWAFDVASGRVGLAATAIPGDGRRPPAQVGRPAEDDRDVRIYYTFEMLREQGVQRKTAIEEIAREIHRSPKAVASVLRKVKTKGLLD